MNKALIPASIFSAIAGGLVVVLLVGVFGVGAQTTTKTVVQPASGSAGTVKPASDTATAADGTALTAAQIYKRDAPSVVYITAQLSEGAATGSGFVIDKNGYILTNAHVVNGSKKTTVRFSNQKTVNATVVGQDTSSDVALLKVDPSGLNLKPLALGSAKTAHVGDPVVAIGNPYGLAQTLTTGVVSALQRQIKSPNGFAIDNVLQTDAAINPGNSGGPLIDASGAVIGINSQIETGGGGSGSSGGNVGIGFSIPIDAALKLVPELKADGSVEHAYLGLATVTVDGTLKALHLPVSSGALVETVTPGSPAAKAGVKGSTVKGKGAKALPTGGDVIVAIDGTKVKTADQVVTLISAKKPGDSVTLTVNRGGQDQDLAVTLGNRPNTITQTQG